MDHESSGHEARDRGGREQRQKQRMISLRQVSRSSTAWFLVVRAVIRCGYSCPLRVQLLIGKTLQNNKHVSMCTSVNQASSSLTRRAPSSEETFEEYSTRQSSLIVLQVGCWRLRLCLRSLLNRNAGPLRDHSCHVSLWEGSHRHNILCSVLLALHIRVSRLKVLRHGETNPKKHCK